VETANFGIFSSWRYERKKHDRNDGTDQRHLMATTLRMGRDLRRRDVKQLARCSDTDNRHNRIRQNGTGKHTVRQRRLSVANRHSIPRHGRVGRGREESHLERDKRRNEITHNAMMARERTTPAHINGLNFLRLSCGPCADDVIKGSRVVFRKPVAPFGTRLLGHRHQRRRRRPSPKPQTSWTVTYPYQLKVLLFLLSRDVELIMKSLTLTSLMMSSRTSVRLNDQDTLCPWAIPQEILYRRKSSYWTATMVQSLGRPRVGGQVSLLLPLRSVGPS